MTRGCIARVSGSGAWYNVVPLPLPAYAPERNPTENLWQYLRGNYLSHEVYENYEAVVNAGRDAWNALIKLPVVILSIGNRAYAQVNIESRWYKAACFRPPP